MGDVAKFGVGKTVETLGDYLREQRLAAKLSLRQLAEQTGVSNPYLSQIERGLRKPSAEVLQQLAKGLRISAETLYVRAGILNLDDSEVRSVELAVLADTRADRAAEAVAARRVPVVPGSERPTRAAPAQEETDMAKTISTTNKANPIRPFYAAVGGVDVAVALARTGLTDVQTRLAKVERRAQGASSARCRPRPRPSRPASRRRSTSSSPSSAAPSTT